MIGGEDVELLATIAAVIGEVGILLGVVTPMLIKVQKIATGERCQLRSEMLNIYYKNKEAKTIRQYEYENFVLMYEAYKALKGNSFIDKIYKDVSNWNVIT